MEEVNKQIYNLRQGSSLIINKTLINGVVIKNIQDCVFLLIRCEDEYVGVCHIDRVNSISSIEDFLKESSKHGIKKITIAGGKEIQNDQKDIESANQIPPELREWFLNPGKNTMKIVENNISKLVLSGVEIKKLEQKGDFYYKCDEDKLQNSENIEIKPIINHPGDNLTAYTTEERRSFQATAFEKQLSRIDVMMSVPLSNETEWLQNNLTKKPNTAIKQTSVSELNPENQKTGFSCNII